MLALQSLCGVDAARPSNPISATLRRATNLGSATPQAPRALEPFGYHENETLLPLESR
jgi:hypothetical protein